MTLKLVRPVFKHSLLKAFMNKHGCVYACLMAAVANWDLEGLLLNGDHFVW